MARTNKEKIWLAEKNWMYKQANFIMGYNIPIRDVPKERQDIGYCTVNGKDSAIYLSNENILTQGLPDLKKRAVHIGTFAHQLSHIQFTDFEYANTFSGTLTQGEAYVFNILFNILEDPAIENFASTFLGKNMVKAMKYITKLSYETSEKLESQKTAFNQFILALIHFGYMGPLKGKFTFTEAKEAFYKNIAIADNIMTEGDAQTRVDMTYTIFENTRSLWKDIADEYSAHSPSGSATSILPGMSGSTGSGTGTGPSDLIALLESLLTATGTTISTGVTCGTDIDPEEVADNADLSKGARRNITIKKLEDMDSDEKESIEENEKNRKESWEKKREEEDSVLSRSSEAEYVNHSMVNDDELLIVTDKDLDLTTDKDYDGEEYEISKEALDSFERLIQTEIELGSAEDKTKTEIPDFPEIAKHYTKRMYKCRNNIIKVSDIAEAKYAYDRIVRKNATSINSVIKQIKTLFVEDEEEEEYSSHGKIDIKKTELSTTVSTKIFTKRKDPKDRSNMAVIIVIDESGSMYGSRIERAKETAICFTEMFGALGIPVYVMGFTADTGGADAYHNHYIFWDNKKDERYRLTTITAQSNNFDGYSIRYASDLLNLRPELHKMMIVISDGQPACSAYSYDGGYRDTKDAIREARSKNQVILGVGIGSDEKILHEMYGLDFIFIERINDLFLNISKKFKSIVSKW